MMDLPDQPQFIYRVCLVLIGYFLFHLFMFTVTQDFFKRQSSLSYWCQVIISFATLLISYWFYAKDTLVTVGIDDDNYSSTKYNNETNQYHAFPYNYILPTLNVISVSWLLCCLSPLQKPPVFVTFLFIFMICQILFFLLLTLLVSDKEKESGLYLTKRSFMIPGLLGSSLICGIVALLRDFYPNNELL